MINQQMENVMNFVLALLAALILSFSIPSESEAQIFRDQFGQKKGSYNNGVFRDQYGQKTGTFNNGILRDRYGQKRGSFR